MVIFALIACGIDTKVDRVNEPPEVVIDAPADGEGYRQGAALFEVRGTVGDTYDEPPDLVVSWSLDGGEEALLDADGAGVVAWTVDAAGLEIGTHTIRLTAIDTDGEGAYDEIQVEVGGPLGPPTVEITAPEDGVTITVGMSLTFTGQATDTTTPAEALDFAWSSDLDGELPGAITGGGQSALLTSALSIGTHVVTLAVEDEDGEIGADAITVVVEDVPEDPVEPEPGDLIFSEVMVNPNAAADEDGEWVELYNTSGSTLDIAGYSFHDDGSDYWVFESSVLVAPHDYVVLCANPNPAVNGGIPCDGWFYRNPLGETPTDGYGSGIAIANNDDELELTSPDGVDIDVFDYNDTTSDPIQTGMSFGLDPTKLDGVENDDVANWCVQTTVIHGATDPGTPGMENDRCE